MDSFQSIIVMRNVKRRKAAKNVGNKNQHLLSFQGYPDKIGWILLDHRSLNTNGAHET